MLGLVQSVMSKTSTYESHIALRIRKWKAETEVPRIHGGADNKDPEDDYGDHSVLSHWFYKGRDLRLSLIRKITC